MARKRKLTTYIIMDKDQAEKLGGIDSFSDSLADEFHNAGALYISSKTHHACWFEDNTPPVSADDLNISFNQVAFEKLEDLSADNTFGFKTVPWQGEKPVQVFIARDLKA